MRTSRVIACLFLILTGTGVWAQNEIMDMTPERYRELKQAGQLPPKFHWGGSMAAPVVKPKPAPDPGKPAKPGVQKGGNVNACNCWLAPDGSYSLAMPPNDDGSSAQIVLPFQYNLYGQLFNTCYINNNGNISFDNAYFTFSSSGFPSSDYVMVAPFWADVDTYGAGQVWYKVTPTALYVNWVGVGYFSSQTDKINTFQLIITDGNDPVIGIGKNTSFCYEDMQWTTGSASGGVNGFGGTPATVGANLGNGADYIQFGRYDHAGVDYDGPFGANDGVSWLDNQNFTFTTEVFTSNIPPIGVGDFLCDTVRVCAGEVVNLEMQFLSPESNQTTTVVSYAPDFSNYTVVTNVPGQTASITTTFTPLPSEAGFHLVTFEATDSGDPPPALTSTYNIVIEVELAASMEPGDTSVCDNSAPVDMYTLLGGNPLPGGTWTAPDGNAHSGTFLPGEDADGAYVYAVGNGGNCPNTGVITMTTMVHADAGDDAAQAYCSSDAPVDLFTLLGGAPQNTGTWTGPGGFAVSSTYDPASDAGGVYVYSITGTTPCPNDASSVQITLQQAVDPGSDGAITLCTDAAPLTMVNALNGNPDAGGAWTAPGGAAFGSSFTAASDAPGVYTYTVAAVLPCPTLSSTLNIAVDALPDAGEDGELTLCADAPSTPLFPTLGGNPDAGGVWQDSNGAAHADAVDPVSDITGAYTYVVNGPGTCQNLTDEAIINVVVNPLPVVTFTVEPDSGCDPLTVTFANTTDPVFVGTSCVWDLGDGTTGLIECGTFEHVYEEAGWYNVNLTVTTPEGCTDHTILQGAVLVEPAPTADFYWTPEFGSDENSNLLFLAEDPHATIFRWDFAGMDSSDQRQAYHLFPNAVDGQYEVCLHVADRYGCADSLCQLVDVVIPAVYVPNAFTPDGNGVNDIFRPEVRGMVAEEHELYVFDRWGQVVFSTRDAAQGWDGAHQNGGDILPQGVYNWRLIERPFGSADKKDWFGTITLLK